MSLRAIQPKGLNRTAKSAKVTYEAMCEGRGEYGI